jgi:hypothetical protein
LTKKYQFTHIKDIAIKHGLPKARAVAAKIARGEALLANENSVPKEVVDAVDDVFPIPEATNGNSPLADDELAPVDATRAAASEKSSLVSAEVAPKAATEAETIAV